MTLSRSTRRTVSGVLFAVLPVAIVDVVKSIIGHIPNAPFLGLSVTAVAIAAFFALVPRSARTLYRISASSISVLCVMGIVLASYHWFSDRTAIVIISTLTLVSSVLVFYYRWWGGSPASNSQPAAISMPAQEVKMTMPDKFPVHVYVPLTGTGIPVGDVILQISGFFLGLVRYRQYVDVVFHDSNQPGNFERDLEDLIQSSPKDKPLGVVICMSKYAKEARQVIDRCIEADTALTNRLTVVYTVVSAGFKSCRHNVNWRYFADGATEAHTLVEAVRAHSKSKGLACDHSQPAILILRDGTEYGSYTSKKIQQLMEADEYVVQVKDVSKLDNALADHLATYQAVVIVAIDQALRTTIKWLQGCRYSGLVFSTTTMSVPEWHASMASDAKPLSLVFTEVIWGDRASDFHNVVETNPNRELLFAGFRMEYSKIHEVVDRLDSEERRSYDGISVNYITAFCFETVRLFHMAQNRKAFTWKTLFTEHQQDVRYNQPILDINYGLLGDCSPELRFNWGIGKHAKEA